MKKNKLAICLNTKCIAHKNMECQRAIEYKLLKDSGWQTHKDAVEGTGDEIRTCNLYVEKYNNENN